MTNARLRLQRLSTQADQVLVVAHLAALRADTGAFRPSDVKALFAALRVPGPSNVPNVLSRLSTRGLVLSLGGASWTLTPEGEEAVAALAIGWSAADLQTEYAADFAQSQHHTIPAELAPTRLMEPLSRFLEAFAFERNVFGISRYPRPLVADDPVPATFATAREIMAEYGLNFHLASDRAVADEMWPNVSALMWGCRFGIVVVEDTANEGVNTNVLIELGAMLMTGRRCVFLRDKSVERVPSDLVGHIRKDVDLRDQATVVAALHDWCDNDLLISTSAH